LYRVFKNSAFEPEIAPQVCSELEHEPVVRDQIAPRTVIPDFGSRTPGPGRIT